MTNLWTTLGEGRAYIRIYSQAYPVKAETEHRYDLEYGRYLRGVLPEHASSKNGQYWMQVGIRHGTLKRMAAALEPLELALDAGDTAAAEAAGAEVKECLRTFATYPPRPLGRRMLPHGQGLNRSWAKARAAAGEGGGTGTRVAGASATTN